MRGYIKYIVLFIILILIGIVGINLYSNKNFNKKEQYLNENILKENNEEEKTEETKGEVTEDKKEETETSTTTDNTSKENTNNDIDLSNKNTNEEVNTNNNQIDLNLDTNTSNNNSNNDYNVIDITESNNSVSIIPKEETTSNNVSNSTNQNNNTSNTITNNNTNDDVIILEVDNSAYQETTTKKPSTNVITSTNTTTSTSNSTNTSQKENTTTKKKEETASKDSGVNNTETKVEKEDETSNGFSTNVSFSNIDNCINNKVVRTVKGSNGKTTKIHTCILKYKLNNKNSMMQSFAITDDYVYFSNPARGAWVKTEAKYQELGKRASLKQTSANYVVRVNKKTNKYQRIYVEYAGHSQSFDATNNGEIYMNYFAKLYKGSIGYGASYVGVTAVNFKNNTKKDGIEVIPTKSTSISKDGKTFSVLNSSNYYVDGKFNSDKYYDKVVSIGTSSNKMTGPEVAVDEKHDRIAFVSGTTAYIYKLSDFKAGKANILNKFTIAGGKQGIELYNNYLYLWTGDKTHNLYKYNISTGNLANKIYFNLNSVYGSNGGGEAEGISIHNGKVYIGISGNIYSDGKKYSDIFLVEGF